MAGEAAGDAFVAAAGDVAGAGAEPDGPQAVRAREAIAKAAASRAGALWGRDIEVDRIFKIYSHSIVPGGLLVMS